MPPVQPMDALRWAFCVVILIAWTVNLALGMIPSANYEPNLAVNAPMMLVLGALLYDLTHPRPEGRRRNSSEDK